MKALVDVLAHFGSELLIGLSLMLLLGAVAVRLSRSPLLRHQIAVLATGATWIALVLFLLPLPRPVRAWRGVFSHVLPSSETIRVGEAGVSVSTDFDLALPDAVRQDTHTAYQSGSTPRESAALRDVAEPSSQAGPSRESLESGWGVDATGRVDAQVPELRSAALHGRAQPDRAASDSALTAARHIAREAKREPGTVANALSWLRGPSQRTWLSLVLFGASLFTLQLCVSLLVLMQTLRRARPAPEWVTSLLRGDARGRRAHVLVSASVARPLCTGLGRGVILLPASLVHPRRRRRVEAVLRHEEAHLTLGHTRARAIAALAAPIVFWNPLYWWLTGVMRHNAELLADELAIVHFDRYQYVQELLALAESSHRPSLPATFGVGVFGPRRPFLARMETLLMRTNRLTTRSTRMHTTLRNSLACLLIGTVSLAWGRPAQEARVDTVLDPYLDPVLGSQRSETQVTDDFVQGRLVADPPVNVNTVRDAWMQELFRREQIEGTGSVTLTFLAEDPTALGRLILLVGGGDIRVESKPGASECKGELTVPVRFQNHLIECSEEVGVLLMKLDRHSASKQETGARANPGDSSLQQEVAELTKNVSELTRAYQTLVDNQKALVQLLAMSRGPATSGVVDPRYLGLPPSQLPVDGSTLRVTGNVLKRTQDDSGPALLLVDLGIQHGLVPGMELGVYSGSVYKGRVQVTDVDTELATCKTLLQVVGTEIGTGDKVTTEL